MDVRLSARQVKADADRAARCDSRLAVPGSVPGDERWGPQPRELCSPPFLAGTATPSRAGRSGPAAGVTAQVHEENVGASTMQLEAVGRPRDLAENALPGSPPRDHRLRRHGSPVSVSELSGRG
jgi:hypothetical protein